VELFIQRLVDGVARGSIYSLLALALVVVFRGTGSLNFAQGEMALFTTYFASTIALSGLPVWSAILIAAILGFIIGAGIERILIEPMEQRSSFSVVVVTIGLFLLFNGADQFAWGPDARSFPSLFPDDPDDFFRLAGAPVRWERAGLFAVLLIVAGGLWVLFNRTKLGLAMRAAATNTESAQLVGIRVGQVRMFSWGLAAAIGAICGALLAPTAGLSLSMMFGTLIYASAAAILGGLDSPVGAVVAGLSIGVLEAMLIGYVEPVGGDFTLTVALGLILVVLIFRPQGLFGTEKVERV
jgi:branched-chain amino acid transport system permease protein